MAERTIETHMKLTGMEEYVAGFTEVRLATERR